MEELFKLIDSALDNPWTVAILAYGFLCTAFVAALFKIGTSADDGDRD